MKHKATFLALVAIAACSVNLFAQQSAVEPSMASQTATNVVSSAAAAPANTIATVTNGQQLPRLIDFGSKQCKACKAMEPILANLAQKYADKFKTEFVDVWVPENEALAKSYGIETIPVQVFLNAEGKEVHRNTGLISEAEVIARFADLGLISATAAPVADEVSTASGTPATSAPAVEPATAPEKATGK
ncbi:MAG TPA: thioredoxin family protein [Candidatus Rifleibacterium sp.]|nr:thioredoxin family protein [Candidatus Rifleibacterium sp.]HPW60335.1 thioredoxin family protein [Candidatus Rifleibacterium sp.]